MFFLALVIMTQSQPAYEIDERASVAFVKVLKDESTLLSKLSHNHVVRAASLSGKVSFDPRRPESCEVRISIPVTDLQVDEAWLRERAEAGGPLSEADRDKIRREMLAKGQLYAARFPTIEYEATACELGEAPGTFKVTGDLTIRGKRKPIESSVEISLFSEGLRARTVFRARHSDFGFQPYSAGLGTLKNRDEMTFVIDIAARPL